MSSCSKAARQSLSESGSLPATAANLEKALAFIQAQPGGGGHQYRARPSGGPWPCPGLPASPALSSWPLTAMCTWKIKSFNLIRQNLGQANLFPFGIGTAVNRHLIEGMARAGMGEPFVVLNQQEAEEAGRQI